MVFTICSVAALVLSAVAAVMARVAMLRASAPDEKLERLEAHIVQLVEETNDLHKFREEDDARIGRLGLRITAVHDAAHTGEKQILAKLKSYEKRVTDSAFARLDLGQRLNRYDQHTDKIYSLDVRLKKAFAGIAAIRSNLAGYGTPKPECEDTDYSTVAETQK